MIKTITTLLFIPLFIACSANKKMNIANETNVKFDMPVCLQSLIKKMTAEPNGSPQSVTRYTYKDQTVYYLVSPCCDKYNVV
ncbi:MAG: hypothetical protein ABIO76_11350, partial [Ginsengibacter sp.]